MLILTTLSSSPHYLRESSCQQLPECLSVYFMSYLLIDKTRSLKCNFLKVYSNRKKEEIEGNKTKPWYKLKHTVSHWKEKVRIQC